MTDETTNREEKMGVLRTGARRGCDEFYSNFIDGLSL
jgi:hypothetical protein